MKNLIISLGILSIIAFSGFMSIDTYRANKEERNLTGFSKIDLAISGKLYYTQSNSYKVVVDANEDDLDNTETEVVNGTLKIKTKNCWTCNFKDVVIYVSSPDMNGMRTSGSGSIYAENDIQTDDMQLKVSGSGKVILKGLQAGDVEAAISGSGDVDISRGNADSFEASISGSGSVDAENLQVKNVDASISGSGSCRIHAGERLTARISGSGNIYYKGQPKMDIASSGSGKVKSL